MPFSFSHPIIFNFHPALRLVLMVVLAQGSYSSERVMQAACVVALGLLQCPRRPHWPTIFWLFIIITMMTFIVGTLFYFFSSDGASLVIVSNVLRLWLFLLSLPILTLYVSALSPLDWVIVSNSVTKCWPQRNRLSLHVSLLVASMSTGIRSLTQVIVDLFMEIRARKLWQSCRRINTLLSLLTVFLTEMLRIASEFHDEWAVRFCPKDNKLADLKHPWSLPDAIAVLMVIVVIVI